MMTPERKEEVRKKLEAFDGWFITCCLECKCFQNQGQDFDCDSVIESMNVAIGELLAALDEAEKKIELNERLDALEARARIQRC